MLKNNYKFILPVILLAGLLFSLAQPVQALSQPGSARAEALESVPLAASGRRYLRCTTR